VKREADSAKKKVHIMTNGLEIRMRRLTGLIIGLDNKRLCMVIIGKTAIINLYTMF